ncbi:MAG: hypothetical protein E7272_11510 [Pseudobutyrivibrio ruminis]|uniref:Listeria/Bacterioides repeat-containing protein n=1 Tax=Pseudobutyrivibrio ruminis TaxID=46206 RepID=A0A927UB66_9FIRM|nr:hypothetical protein [Pseudobutyrivibrio ruminis]
MEKTLRKAFSFCLALVMTFTTVVTDVHATELQQSAETTEVTENTTDANIQTENGENIINEEPGTDSTVPAENQTQTTEGNQTQTTEGNQLPAANENSQTSAGEVTEQPTDSQAAEEETAEEEVSEEELLVEEADEEELLNTLSNEYTLENGVLTIKEGVTKIDKETFKSNKDITTIVFPTSLKEIGDSAFYGCENLEAVDFPKSLVSIGKNAFCGCKKLTTLIIPENVKTIGDLAFGSTNITSVTILSKDVDLSGGTDYYGSMFSHNTVSGKKHTLTEVNLPEGMRRFPRLFAFCNFTGEASNLTMPASITAITPWAFHYVEGLKSIDFPGNNLQKFDRKVFYDVYSIDYFVCNKGTTTEASLKSFINETKKYRNYGHPEIVTRNTIKYVLNGGTVDGTNPTGFTKADAPYTITSPTREFYDFKGWYFDAKFTKPAIAIENIKDGKGILDVAPYNDNITLYAKWEGPIYNITFDAKGGTASKTEVRYVKGDVFGELPTVTPPAGKTFLGWFTKEGVEITSNSKVDQVATSSVVEALYSTVVTTVDAPSISLWGQESVADATGKIPAELNSKVTISTTTEDAEITYSISGVATVSNQNYESEILLNKAGEYVITAKATKDGATSEQTSVTFVVADEEIDEVVKADEDEDKFVVTYKGKKVENGTETHQFTGSKVTFESKDIKVYYNKKALKEKVDYTISYENNTKAATFEQRNASGKLVAPALVINLKGNYAGKIKKYFTIKDKSENAEKLASNKVVINLEQATFTYKKDTEAKPAITVQYKKSAKEIIDIDAKEYTVTYANNINAGKNATVTVIFTGEKYYGTASKKFEIKPIDLAQLQKAGDLAISDSNASSTSFAVKANKGKKPSDLYLHIKSTNECVDYAYLTGRSVKFVKDKNTGKMNCVATFTGKTNYKGKVTFTVPVEKTKLSDATVYGINSAGYNKYFKASGLAGVAAFANTVVAPIYNEKKVNYKKATYTLADNYGTVLGSSDYSMYYQVKTSSDSSFKEPANIKYPAGTEIKITFTAKDNSMYEGTKEVVYKILEGSYYNITNEAEAAAFETAFDVTCPDVVYAKKANNWVPKLKVYNPRLNVNLKENREFTVVYNVVNETVVSGKYKNKATKTVLASGAELKKDAKYTVPVGTVVRVTITGTGTYEKCQSYTTTFRIGYNINSVKVTVKAQDYSNKNSGVVPTKSDITVTLKNTPVNSSNYQITHFAKNNKKGTATFELIGKNNYVGTKKVSYKINPKKFF